MSTYDDDDRLPGSAEQKHTRNSVRQHLIGLLAARGVVVSTSDKLKWAHLEDALDRDVSISLDGATLTILANGVPARGASTEAALNSLANELAVKLGGTEAPVPVSFEEVKQRQRERDPGLYSF
jgi:hypothetical protein